MNIFREKDRKADQAIFTTDFKVLINEFDPDMKSVRFGLPGILIILEQAVKSFDPDYPEYSCLVDANKFLINEFKKMSDSFTPEYFKSVSCNYGLSEGIAGQGLVSIFFPQIFMCNDL